MALVTNRNERALEIGVYEGRSTCWLLENILTGEGSTIDCIDTFAGGIEHVYRGLDMAAVRTRFEANTPAQSQCSADRHGLPRETVPY